jgi:hypothetical protein
MSEQAVTKQELWARRINDYRISGLTALEWCQQNNFPVSTLRYWVYKLSNQKKDSEPVFAEVPVYATNSFLGAAPVTIYMGTLRIEIMDSCHPGLLSSLIGILTNHA